MITQTHALQLVAKARPFQRPLSTGIPVVYCHVRLLKDRPFAEKTVHRFDAILHDTNGAKKPWDRAVAETNSFIAIPSLGSMVAGWLLIIPRRPMLNMRGLKKSERQELRLLVAELTSKLKVFPGDVYAFEHGNTSVGGATGCGVDQAHLHVVPLQFDLLEAASSANDPNIEWTSHIGVATFETVIPARGEYVSVWRPSDGQGLSGAMRDPRSQWLRRVIAGKLNRDEAWDYKAHPDIHNLMQTVEMMLPA